MHCLGRWRVSGCRLGWKFWWFEGLMVWRFGDVGVLHVLPGLKGDELQKTTWSHKNLSLCALSVHHRFTYLTAHFAAVSKRHVHWVALRHRLNTWTLARFYYVDIGMYCCVFYVDIVTYCCVFIMLLQVRTAAVQNSNIRGLSLKVNTLSCWKYALHQTQP